MSLLSSAMQRCVFMNEQTAPDPQGGFTITWTDGAEFDAAIVFDSSIQARTAEKMGVTSLYSVTVPKGVPLHYYSVFRRLSDGLTLRVTSRDTTDKQTPESASFQVSQLTAEQYEVTQ